MDDLNILARLAAATLIGGVIGLNRDLHGKPAGVRTNGIVGLSAALAVLAASIEGEGAGVSRVIQGILTGVGFLGAGVIVRRAEAQIQGLTTAACIWLSACVGVTAGIGAWKPLLIAVALAFVLLILGGPFEKMLHRRWSLPPDD